MSHASSSKDIEYTEDKANGIRHFAMRWTLPKGCTHDDACGVHRESLKSFFGSVGISRYIYQLECPNDSSAAGSTTNLHFQIYAYVSNKIRATTLKGVMYGSLKCVGQTLAQFYVEPASDAGKMELKKYCMKDKTRVAGPWTDQNPDKPPWEGKEIKDGQLYAWQDELKKVFIQDCKDDRIVHWLGDIRGRNGKTFFLKHMYMNNPKETAVISYSDHKHMMHIIAKHKNKNLYIFNLTKTQPAEFKIADLYHAIEAIKDGVLQDPMYDSDFWVQKTAHVLVLSNFKPDMKALINDRWHFMSINEKGQIVHE